MRDWREDTAGLQRVVEIGLRVAPTASSAPAAAAAIRYIITSSSDAPVRIVGVGSEGNRVVVTLAITVGTTAEIAAGAPAARSAVGMVARLIEGLGTYDPAFTALPNPDSADAIIGMNVDERPETLTRAMCVLGGQV